MTRFFFCAVFLTYVVSASVIAGQTGTGPSAKKVRVTTAAGKPDAKGEQVIVLTVSIDKGWHIHANPVGNAKYEENRTLVTLTSKSKVEVVKIDYPPGTLFGEGKNRMRVYEDKVLIRAIVRRPAADVNPVELSLRVYACDANNCLPRGNIKVTVP